MMIDLPENCPNILKIRLLYLRSTFLNSDLHLHNYPELTIDEKLEAHEEADYGVFTVPNMVAVTLSLVLSSAFNYSLDFASPIVVYLYLPVIAIASYFFLSGVIMYITEEIIIKNKRKQKLLDQIEEVKSKIEQLQEKEEPQ